METERDLLRTHVRDMLAVESEIHGAFRRQERDRRLRHDSEARALVARIEETIDRHLLELKGCLRRLGGEESKLKNALGAVLGTAAGFYDRMRADDPISRMLRDDSIALSTAIVCYEMLHATALAADDEDVAALALRHVEDYAPLVMGISELLPHAIVRELSREGKLPPNRDDAAARAAENTRRAWSAQAPASATGAAPAPS